METQPDNQEDIRDAQGRFVPGRSGNPAGRPKGQTLKEYARQWFSEMSERDKKDFLAKLDPHVVWRMAEGNPAEEKKLGITGAITTAQLSPAQVERINQVIFDEWDNDGEPQEETPTGP